MLGDSGLDPPQRGSGLVRNNRINVQISGYLVHKKQNPPRTLQQDYAQDPTVVLGGGAVSYERGTPVGHSAPKERCINNLATGTKDIWYKLTFANQKSQLQTILNYASG